MNMNVEQRIKTATTLPKGRRTIIHIMLVNNHIQDVLHRALKPHDLSIQQFNVMRILRGQKGEPANLSTLNERMVSRMSNTTRLVDKLIVKGYVNRRPCPENRRKIEIRLTKDGLSALTELDRVVEDAENELLNAMSIEDLDAMNNLLDKISINP